MPEEHKEHAYERGERLCQEGLACATGGVSRGFRLTCIGCHAQASAGRLERRALQAVLYVCLPMSRGPLAVTAGPAVFLRRVCQG